MSSFQKDVNDDARNAIANNLDPNAAMQRRADGPTVLPEEYLKKHPQIESASEPVRFQSARQLIKTYTSLRQPIINGLLRQGETMNIIAPPKTGKSWLVLDLGVSVATGRTFLGLNTVPGRVLILDNELHPETIANRIPRVATAKGIDVDEFGDNIQYDLLRGNLKDIYSLEPTFLSISAGFFSVIILDAFYRFLPKNTDENDNGSMAALYNQLDYYADHLRCAFVLIHHTSKGLQTGRAITDVGAGAGAISRAADSHLILRPHSEDGAVVLDAAPRSWSPMPATCLRFDFPLWKTAPDLDPADLKKPTPKKPKPVCEAKPEKPVKWTHQAFVNAFFTTKPKLKNTILAEAHEKLITSYAFKELLQLAEGAQLVHRWDNGHKQPMSYATVPQPKLALVREVLVSECASNSP